MYLTARLFAIVIVFTFVSTPVCAEIHYYTEGHADLGLGEGDELELHVAYAQWCNRRWNTRGRRHRRS